jgi:hypothetical protein
MQLIDMAQIAEASGYNLDYFPTNFIVCDETLYYIDYEINLFDPEWSLKNWGIYYWANTDGFKEFLVSGDASKINLDIDNGIPVKEPFKQTVNCWMEKFQNSGRM